jgi:hypothetical protein
MSKIDKLTKLIEKNVYVNDEQQKEIDHLIDEVGYPDDYELIETRYEGTIVKFKEIDRGNKNVHYVYYFIPYMTEGDDVVLLTSEEVKEYV